MRPRTDEILLSLLWTFEHHIAPEVQSDFAKSLTLTMSNLLQHVHLRVQFAGEYLHAERSELRELLTDVATYLREGGEPDFPDLAEEITQALAATEDDGCYPSEQRLVAALTTLRGALSRALIGLQQARSELGSSAAYQRIRSDIRQHLARTLEREGRLIEPAFTRDRR